MKQKDNIIENDSMIRFFHDFNERILMERKHEEMYKLVLTS